MELTDYGVLDFFNNPIFVTDGSSKVIYKNISAKKNIPSPRMGCAVKPLTDTEACIYPENQRIRIETLKKARFYKRAIVCGISNTDNEMWFFYPALQYYVPDNKFFSDSDDIQETIETGLKLISDNREIDDIEKRYDNLSGYFLKLISTIDIRTGADPYSASEMIKLTKTYTTAALSKFNRRFSYEPLALDPTPLLTFDLLPFVNMYVNMLSTIIRISGGNRIDIKVVQDLKKYKISFSGRIKRGFKNAYVTSAKSITDLFPSEYLNGVFTEELGEYFGCKTFFELKDNEAEIGFYIPLKDKKIFRSANPASDIEKEIADRFMSAMQSIVF